MCTSIGQSRIKCSITPFFFHIFIEKSDCHDWVWYDKYLERIYQKWKILTLAHIFAYNSKSILPQRASYSRAGTLMWAAFEVTGHDYYKFLNLANSVSIAIINIICKRRHQFRFVLHTWLGTYQLIFLKVSFCKFLWEDHQN